MHEKHMLHIFDKGIRMVYVAKVELVSNSFVHISKLVMEIPSSLVALSSANHLIALHCLKGERM